MNELHHQYDHEWAAQLYQMALSEDSDGLAVEAAQERLAELDG